MKLKKAKSKKSRPVYPVTTPVKLIKHGSKTFLPVPTELLKTLKAREGVFYVTAVDGVLQVSGGAPVMVIPILDRPEARFGRQHA